MYETSVASTQTILERISELEKTGCHAAGVLLWNHDHCIPNRFHRFDRGPSGIPRGDIGCRGLR